MYLRIWFLEMCVCLKYDVFNECYLCEFGLVEKCVCLKYDVFNECYLCEFGFLRCVFKI